MSTVITLSGEELTAITGYTQPTKQLAELLRMGYWRARRAPLTGRVVLERAHYEAVCSGQDHAPLAKTKSPGLLPA